MARLSCIVLFIAMNVFMCVFGEEEHYPTRYDNVDMKAALQNAVVREQYYNCFMELAPCETDEQATLSGIYSEAYQTNCKKCTEKQREMFDIVADWWSKNEPERWQLIIAKTLEKMKKKNASQ